MKRLATVALIVAAIASPSFAQRGSSHGGFSSHSGPSIHSGFSHSAPAFHGGFTGSAPSRSIAPPRYFAARPPVAARSSMRNGPGNLNASSGFAYHPGHRPPYRGDNRFGWGIPYNYSPSYPGSSNWFNPYSLGYPGYGADDDSSAAEGYAPQGNPPEDYAAQPENEGTQEPPPWPSYNPPPPAAAPQSSEPVTLVFIDGTPSEQIRNYILTPAALYVYDVHRREIPIGHIDLAATAKANHDAGVDFSLPAPPR